MLLVALPPITLNNEQTCSRCHHHCRKRQHQHPLHRWQHTNGTWCDTLMLCTRKYLFSLGACALVMLKHHRIGTILVVVALLLYYCIVVVVLTLFFFFLNFAYIYLLIFYVYSQTCLLFLRAHAHTHPHTHTYTQRSSISGRILKEEPNWNVG